MIARERGDGPQMLGPPLDVNGQHVREGRTMTEGSAAQGMHDSEMCPMASMCMRRGTKPWSGFLLMMPGLLLVLGGVVILIEPRVLIWLIGGTSILIGIIMVGLANSLRRMSASFTKTTG